jgi:hypothetical protein
MRFEGRVALVTGGASGIGAATSRRLAADGAAVVVADVDDAAGEKVAGQIVADGGRAVFQHTDVSEQRSVEEMVARAVTEYGGLTLAANVAGIPQAPVPLHETPVEVWERGVAVNQRGIWLSMRVEIPLLLEAGGGAIVNVTSLAGLRPFAGLTGYVTSKHGADGLVKNAAADYVGQGIRVNGVAPGTVETPMLMGHDPAALQAYREAQPMKRMATPEEIANVITFLLPDEASYVTGVVVPVDGGWVVS